MTTKKQELQSLLINGKIDVVLKQLLETTNDNSVENVLINLSSRHNDLKRQSRLGILSYDDLSIRRNKIFNSILELINELEESLNNVGERSHKEEKQNRKNGNGDRSIRKQLALLIGCNKYENSPTLYNPINDANGIAKKLDDLGFILSVQKDLDFDSLRDAIFDFSDELEENDSDTGLFFFAGHGSQVNGENYLVPVNDKNVNSSKGITRYCVNADLILNGMNIGNKLNIRKRTNIIILDACRNNPFARGLSRGTVSRGLSSMDAPTGTLIAYSTAPGTIALDGKGNNSPYCSELIQKINSKGLTINQMFQNVRASVLQKTNYAQTPWESSCLTADYCFNPI